MNDKRVYTNKTYAGWGIITDLIPENTCSVENHFEFETFRLGFFRDYQKMLNSLLTVEVYSRFRSYATGKKVSPRTVEYWILKKKVDVVTICGRVFVFVPYEEMTEMNDYYIENELKNEAVTAEQKRHHERIFKFYSKQQVFETCDTFAEFVAEKGWQKTGYKTHKEHKYVSDEYESYCDWCERRELRPITPNMFSKKITEVGFKRTRVKRRGFIVFTELSSDAVKFSELLMEENL